MPPLPLAADHWQAIVAVMKLSPRQAEVAALVARGAQLKDIATLLEISIPTVRTQLERTLRKTGARNRAELLLRILDVSHRVDTR